MVVADLAPAYPFLPAEPSTRHDFAEFQAESANFAAHLNSLSEALSVDAFSHERVRNLLSNLLIELRGESLAIILNGRPNSREFIRQTWNSFSATFGRLTFMNGIRSRGLNDLIASDNLATNADVVRNLAEFKSQFPQAKLSHEILSLEPTIREIFSQWYSGANSTDFDNQLRAYYERFQFDDKTTANYTDHGQLIALTTSHLKERLIEYPLSPGAKITFIGPGGNPSAPEFLILSNLLAENLISPSQIDGVDIQTARKLGLKPEDFPPKYKFHGGLPLEDWSQAVSSDPGAAADLVFFLGSVNNNDPNYFHQLQDFLALSRTLKPGGILVYDTASLEESETHLRAWRAYYEKYPESATGTRPSAHFSEFVARIYPAYFINSCFNLAGFTAVDHVIWEASPGKSRHLILAEKTLDQITPLGSLIEALIPPAYSVPPGSRRPWPVAAATA